MNMEQPTPATNSPKWNKKKIVLVFLTILLITGISLSQFLAAQVRQAAEQSLLAKISDSLNAKILVGSVDLSILGSVEAKDVQVLDAEGKKLLQSKRILIRYNWNDLFHGQLSPQLVTAVTVESPEFWIVYDQNQLNWEQLFKTKADETSRFSGLIEIQDSKLHMETAFFNKTIEQLNGRIDCRQANSFGLSANGKVDQVNVALDGQWSSQAPSAITMSAQGLDVVKLGLTTPEDPLQLTNGQLDELTIKLVKDISGLVSVQTLSGRCSALNTAGVLTLTQGSARFEKQDNALAFTEIQALYKGQSVTASGRVLTAPDNSKTLDFTVDMPSGDPAAILPNSQAGGTLTARGTITGSELMPVLAGDFTLGSLQFGDMTLNGIQGSFSYSEQMLTLFSASGASTGGSIFANGQLYPDSDQYNLSISGSGLDSSRLTEKDVKGPLAFSGTATGGGASAVAQGSFTIYNGTAYGFAFRTLTGNFVKSGSAAAVISNLMVQTDLGTFYPERLSQEIIEQLHQPNLPTTPKELEKVLNDRVNEIVTDKLLKNVFR